MQSGAGRTISWNSFDMPLTITKSPESSTFYYGADRERVKQVRSDGVTIWYAGAMEVESGGATKVKANLPNGLGVEIESAGASKVNYVHHDRLGSVMAMSDEAGALSEQLAYDAWGKGRQQATPLTPDSIDGTLDNKGFTGHEMLDRVDLVHMNGRVYDPLVARFISADSIIQQPEHSQSYNRYTYVWNNPTNLTDPTGFVSQDERLRQQAQIATKNCENMGGNCQNIGTTGFKGSSNQSGSGDSKPTNAKDASGGAGKATQLAADKSPSSGGNFAAWARASVGTRTDGEVAQDMAEWIDEVETRQSAEQEQRAYRLTQRVEVAEKSATSADKSAECSGISARAVKASTYISLRARAIVAFFKPRGKRYFRARKSTRKTTAESQPVEWGCDDVS